jgi:pyruvate dehydrogenase E1 component alpha subunit
MNKLTFEIKYSKFLDENGDLLKKAPDSINNKDSLLHYYKIMCLIREFDKKAISLQRTGKIGTYSSNLGHEAISTAIGASMQKTDILAPYYRDYAAQYMRGVKLSEILTYWGGSEQGNNYKNNKFDLPISVPIASQCLIGAGVAFAIKYKKLNYAVVATCGDGGTSKGDFYEALNISGTWDLPIVFIIHNNKWAISTPYSSQTKASTLAQKAIAAGIDGIQVDGNDIIALNFEIDNALKIARKHSKPTLIEALTYRLGDHTTADDASKYRSETEVVNAKKYDSILRLKKYLTKNDFLNDNKEQLISKEIKKIVENSVNEYLNTPMQSVESIFDYQYDKLPKFLIDQKNELLGETCV